MSHALVNSELVKEVCKTLLAKIYLERAIIEANCIVEETETSRWFRPNYSYQEAFEYLEKTSSIRMHREYYTASIVYSNDEERCKRLLYLAGVSDHVSVSSDCSHLFKFD